MGLRVYAYKHLFCALTATAESVAPSRDYARSARGGTAAGQSHSVHVAVQGGSTAQLNEHDVIIQGVTAIAGMPDDCCRADDLLCSFIGGNVVLTKTNLNTTEQNKLTDHNVSHLLNINIFTNW